MREALSSSLNTVWLSNGTPTSVPFLLWMIPPQSKSRGPSFDGALMCHCADSAAERPGDRSTTAFVPPGAM